MGVWGDSEGMLRGGGEGGQRERDREVKGETYDGHHVEVEIDGPDGCCETAEDLVVLGCVSVALWVAGVDFAEDQGDGALGVGVEEGDGVFEVVCFGNEVGVVEEGFLKVGA